MKYRIFLAMVTAMLAMACSSRTSDIDKKVDALLSRMTLEEKIGQMNQRSGGAELCELVSAGQVGSVLNCTDPKQINALQKAAVEHSRLGIPVLVGRDVIHGFHTIFPVPLAQAATFNPELVEKGARIAATEASAYGIRWTFSPMLDIARDPRWGRSVEGFGEDPYLDTRMGVAMVKGYQGEDLSDPTSIAACMKHFIGYGAAEGGRDYNGGALAERLLRNVYMPAFKACVDAGVATVMTSFNEIDGIPSTGNRWLVTDVLRNEWGFEGMVVTDWNSSGEMINHGFSTDLKHATEQSINAGVDMDMESYGYIKYIEDLVKAGKVKESDIDSSVRNILRLKYRLGLFDNPYIDEGAAGTSSYTEESLAVARQCALESVVLLKNEGSVLPLEDARTILVTGPMADAPYEQMGTWVFDGQQEHTVTPLQSLKEYYDVIYEPGLEYSRDASTSGLSKVKAAASRADAIIVFVGEESILSGEGHSMSDLCLKGAQSDLISTAKATGKPVVVVVMAGRILTVGKDLGKCDAMLYSLHPGTMGGPAIADLIKGKACPSGKLPMTMLVEAGQAPYYYNHFNTGRPAQGTETLLDEIPIGAGQTSLGNTSYYLDSGYGPLFPFGYGLSYTTFSYSRIRLDAEEYGVSDTIRVEYDLTNTGNREGTETCMLFVRDLVGSTARPVKELKGFEKISLSPGETRHCCFELPVDDLAFYGLDMERKVEPGEFDLWVAGDSASGQPLRFTVR